ncbi:(2Fe-2S)-binding protein [Albimonas pacifica]|uniref:Ferric iron reductase FhuF-like transporter n=1 Tax=Albimonas pacifica TaxID=1114924 RepID=A0A1I3DC29_9RHOB|nr:(2Fe-2S)-binding protein [Albimonas pacifica]SFH84186.1 Ferric iron reductase FhuF-like transporter [Albimonas pacifica]
MSGQGRNGATAPPTESEAAAAAAAAGPAAGGPDGGGGGASGHPLDAVFAALARPRPHLRPGRADAPGGAAPEGRPALAALCADAPALRALLERPRRHDPRLTDKILAASLIILASGPVSTLAAACLLGAGIVPRLGAERVAFAVGTAASAQERDPIHLDLLDPGFDAAPGPFAAHPQARPLPDRDALRTRMREELEGFLAPLVAALHRETRLSRAALWRLAGDAVAGEFLDVGRFLGREDLARDDALAILKVPGAPMTNPQLRYLEVEIPDPQRPDRPLLRRSFRARGGCCLWKDLPGASLCTTCVLRPEAEMRARVEAGLRRRLGLPAPDPAP